MTKHELITALESCGDYDDGCLVVFQDVETGAIFSIKEVVYEGAGDDGEGHATSTGSTCFIRGESQ